MRNSPYELLLSNKPVPPKQSNTSAITSTGEGELHCRPFNAVSLNDRPCDVQTGWRNRWHQLFGQKPCLTNQAWSGASGLWFADRRLKKPFCRLYFAATTIGNGVKLREQNSEIGIQGGR